jgi:plastocyanin
MKRTLAALLFLSLLLLTVSAGCGRGNDSSGEVRSGEVPVTMKNLKYVPPKLTVKAGTRITFTNGDAMDHDVVQLALQDFGKKEPGFTSDVIPPGKSWSIVMTKPGIYPILCTQLGHYTQGMIGTITVVD